MHTVLMNTRSPTKTKYGGVECAIPPRDDGSEPPRQAIMIRGAGVEEVNGTYTIGEKFHGAYHYTKCSKWKGQERKICVLRCPVRNGRYYWYISIVPVEGEPGTSSDVDLYFCQLEDSVIPPINTWMIVPGSPGKSPPPLIAFGHEYARPPPQRRFSIPPSA